MVKKSVLIILCFLLILQISIPAGASSLPLPYKIRDAVTITFYPSNRFGSTTINHFNEALYEWNRLSNKGRTLMKRSTSTHSLTNYPSKDGVSRIYKNAVGVNEYLARVEPYPGLYEDYITEADININASVAWANSALANHYDVWSVFCHEAGHVLGIDDDYTDSTSLMYKYWSGRMGTTNWRKPKSADIITFNQIYN